ncbi:MAG: GH116 family glycosyl hydrolase [Mariniphaga sp.]|nr:GH116 family glycosyl hydrolase [Mariniphaga sp.]MDD4425737.1 GH116 family glycosyl hydrolase [Mariniphaga sp.]
MKRFLSFIWVISFCTTLSTNAQYNDVSTYQGNKLQTLRIPVGGIGTGNILMGGRGNIEHLEIFNRPDRQRRLEKTFFSLWIKEEGKQPHITLLEREEFPPYMNVTHQYAGGLPRMSEAILENNYPRLRWQFHDEKVPADISLELINPIIPLDYESSNYPICKFNWIIQNPTDNAIEASIALSMENPVKAKNIVNQFLTEGNIQGIQFTAEGEDVPVNYQGALFMGTPASGTDIQTHWYPGTWRDETHIFWDDFSDDGRIQNKKEKWHTTYKPASYNESTKRMATVLVPFILEPGEKITIPFYLSWYFPRRTFNSGEVFGIEEATGKIFNNTYTERFKSEIDVLAQFIRSEQKILAKAEAFAQILSNSSIPDYVIEALNTQISSLASPLIQITAEGDVHGFEGVLNTDWCCPGTCTHVWNYEQTLASLFPSLERKMREIEFLHNTFEDGFQTHRSVIPAGNYWFNGPAAADGQMGTIVRAYREWKLSGDNEWLARLWPNIKKALEFAWYGSGEPTKEKTGNEQQAWDENKTGILSKRQHNTYDIDFYGPNSMTTSLYLAALKAGSEMAAAMGEKKKSKEYFDVFKKGSQLMIDSLWNGDYFIQIIVDDHHVYSEEKLSPPDEQGKKIPKYQYGNGCLADQLLGQYLAFVSGLGYIAGEEYINKALLAIYENNFIENLRDFPNVQRVYGVNNEAGMVLCTWPKEDRPVLPFVYAEEIWTGVEFQVAASLIYSGRVKEGLRVVEAIQDRYNGFKRNPFEHNESGVHYARALASWSVLLALTGTEFDGIKQELTFAPKMPATSFSSFWSTSSAWGEVIINQKEAKIQVTHGNLSIQKLNIQKPGSSELKTWNYKKGKIIPEGETLVLLFDE